MSDNNKGRWWEDYLVRYLTPMLLGTMLIAGLITIIAYDGDFNKLKSGFLLSENKEANASAFFGLLILGFGFAYLSSTPITIFHAGRMFRKGMNKFAGYAWIAWFLITLTLLIVWITYSILCNQRLGDWFVFCMLIAAALPSLWMFVGQSYVIWIIRRDRGPEEDKDKDKDKFEDYYSKLATARNTSPWAREIRESYTHLREHSNSVFICVAEISLSAAILLLWRLSSGQSDVFWIFLLTTGLLWISPNVLLWSVANRLEKYLTKNW